MGNQTNVPFGNLLFGTQDVSGNDLKDKALFSYYCNINKHRTSQSTCWVAQSHQAYMYSFFFPDMQYVHAACNLSQSACCMHSYLQHAHAACSHLLGIPSIHKSIPVSSYVHVLQQQKSKDHFTTISSRGVNNTCMVDAEIMCCLLISGNLYSPIPTLCHDDYCTHYVTDDSYPIKNERWLLHFY